MSLLHRVMGNASLADFSEINEKINPFLVPGEEIVSGYKLIRDLIIFTTERLILIDILGISVKKQSITSYPYSSVKWYSMESAGTLDLDSEIKLGVQQEAMPISLKFRKDTDLNPIYQQLSKYILRDN
jgi:hypothetical protein